MVRRFRHPVNAPDKTNGGRSGPKPVKELGISVRRPSSRRSSPALLPINESGIASSLCSSRRWRLRRQHPVELGGFQGFSVPVGDDYLPALAPENARLGNRDEYADSFAAHLLVLSRRNDPIGQLAYSSIRNVSAAVRPAVLTAIRR